MTLSEQELRALYNLADKEAGQEVGWISISDARALTEHGLARRTPSGWVITSEGASFIETRSRPTATLSSIAPAANQH